ncbi:hypothetical protein BDW72DRAFT_7400 [Aspergillus terricola var. indicus]
MGKTREVFTHQLPMLFQLLMSFRAAPLRLHHPIGAGRPEFSPALDILSNVEFRSNPNRAYSAGHGLPPDGRTEPSVSIRARRIRVIRSSIRDPEVGRWRSPERSRFLIFLMASVGAVELQVVYCPVQNPTYTHRAGEHIRSFRRSFKRSKA